jgi:4'-phosphopantetheinyl transferase
VHDRGMKMPQVTILRASMVAGESDAVRRRRLERIECRTDVVHVVGFRLDDTIDGAIDLLDGDERDRAARFVFDQDRRRFIASHAVTRLVLADCLGCAAESLRFSLSPFGKPRVVDPPEDVRFSLSHAGERALLAIALGQEIGVDLEAHRAIEVIDMARRFFGPREIEALEMLPEAERPPAFFRCWARKEAFIKALGQGLSFPLDGFEVSVEDDGSRQLLRACAAAPDALSSWRIVALDAEPGYAAALAAGPTSWQVCRWEATPPRG